MPQKTDIPDIVTITDIANRTVSRKLFDIAFTTEEQKQALKQKELEWQEQAKHPKQANNTTYAEKARLTTPEENMFKSFNGNYHEQDLWDRYRCLINDETNPPVVATAKSELIKQAQTERTKTLDQIKGWLNENSKQPNAPSMNPRQQNGNLLSENEQNILTQIFASSSWESEVEHEIENKKSKNRKANRRWRKPRKTKKKKSKKQVFSLEVNNQFQALSDNVETQFPPEPIIREPESDSTSDNNSENNKAIKTKKRRKKRRTEGKNGKSGTCKECLSDCLTDDTDTEFFKPKQMSKRPPPVIHDSLSEKETEPSNDESETEPKVLPMFETQNGDWSFPDEPEWDGLTDLISESEMESLPSILPIELDASTEIHSIVEPEPSSYFNRENTKNWPMKYSYPSQARIREQPFISTSMNSAGNKFRVLFTVMGGQENHKPHLFEGVLDSGAFLSTISMTMVRKLGLKPYRVEPSFARSATDKMLIEYNIQIDLDFGGIKTRCTFAIITHPSYKQNLWLIGANFLEELDVNIKFGKKIMYISEKFPVKLYTSFVDANNAAIEIRNNKLAKNGVDIIAPHNIVIEGTKFLDVTLKPEQKDKLRGKNVIGRINSKNPLITAPQYFYEPSNNWDHPIPLKIMTENKTTTVIKRGEKIFSLRQTMERNEIRIDSYPEDNLIIESDPPSLGNTENSVTQTNDITVDQERHGTVDGENTGENTVSAIHGNDVTATVENQMGALVMHDPLSFFIQKDDVNILENEFDDNYILILDEGERFLEDSINADFEEEVDPKWREGGLIGVVEADRKRKRDDDDEVEPSFEDLKNDIPSKKHSPLYKIADEDFAPEIIDQVRKVVMEATDPEPGDFVTEDKELPQWIKSKMRLEDLNARPPNGKDRTRLVKRPWTEADEKLFIEARNERERDFDFIGKDRFFEKISFGSLMTEEWTEKFKNLLWSYRGTFGDQVYHLKSPMKYFGAHYGKLIDADNPGVKARKCSEFGAEVFKRVMKIHLDGNVLGYSCSEGKNFAHIVEKKLPEGMKRITTVAELEQCSSADLQKRYRLTVDLSKMSKQIYPFSIPLPSPKTIIYKLHTHNFWSSFDLLSFFFQLSLTASSSEMTNFIGGGDNSCVYTFFRNVMGCRAALALSAACSFLNYPTADISYVDNLITVDKSLAQQYKKIEQILKASYENGFILKWSGTAVGLTALETKFEIMGFIISMGKVTIPAKDHFSQSHNWPRTKKFIQKLTNSLNYFNNTSCCFSVITAAIRAEMRLVSDERKFIVSNRLENLVNMLLILIKHNKGIRLLSEKELQEQPKFLFCDASKMGFGATLLTIKNKHLVPIAATSRSFSKTNQYLCCNFLETYAVYLAMHLFAPLISLTHTVVLSDSAYCVRMHNTPNFELIPRKLRKQVIELKSRFDYSVIKIAGKENIEADILSRFCIPQPPVTSSELENFDKIAKIHMKSIELDESKKQYLLKKAEKGMKISNWAEIHEEIGEMQNFSQEVYHVGKTEKLKPCTFLDEQCDPCSKPNQEEHGLTENMVKLSMKERKPEYKKIDGPAAKINHLSKPQKGEKYVDDREPKAEKAQKEENLDEQMSDQKETFWDTENSETEMDCEDVETDSSIEAHKLRLEKKKVKFQKDEINTIDPVKVDLPRKLKTIHEVNDELISTAPLTYSQNQVERIKKAKFILISDSDVDGENHSQKITSIKLTPPVDSQVDGRQTQPALSAQTTDQIPPTDTQAPMAISRDCSSDQKSPSKRKQTSQEHLSEAEDSQDSSETEHDRKKTKVKQTLSQVVDSPMDQQVDRSLADEVDQEISIIIGENQTQANSFGLNSVEKQNNIYRLQRDIELETDQILTICADIDDFNTDQLSDYASSQTTTQNEINLDILALEQTSETELVKKVKSAQMKSQDIQHLIELVTLNKRPTRIEMRSKSEFIKSAVRDFDLLSVSNSLLYRKYVTQNGTVKQLLVVPEEISTEMLKLLHLNLAHAKPLRVKEIMFRQVFIYNFSKLSKEMACVQCALAAKPVFRKPRKISTRNSTIGEEISFDLLFLPRQKFQGNYYKYCLVICESCSGFLIARKLKTKRMSEVKANLEECLLSFHILPSVAIHDAGTEFVNHEIQQLFKELKITSCIVTNVNKNSNMAESIISSLTNTLRKMGDESNCWPQVLQQAVFSINHSLREYAPGHVYTAAQVFNNRSNEPKIPFFEDEESFDIHKNIKEMNKARFHDDYNIALCLKERFVVKVGDILLCHEEKVLAKKALNCERTAVKLSAYWAICKVQEIVNEDIVIVKTNSGVRKSHIRQLKRIPQNLMDEIQREKLADF